MLERRKVVARWIDTLMKVLPATSSKPWFPIGAPDQMLQLGQIHPTQEIRRLEHFPGRDRRSKIVGNASFAVK
jgi:hypothetical protein